MSSQEFLEQALNEVVNGKADAATLPFSPIIEIESILTEKLGFEEIDHDDDDTNGWQVDFWYKIKHPEKGLFTISGGLYYGDMKFSKNKN